MRMLRLLLVGAVFLGCLVFGWQFASGNAERIQVNYLFGPPVNLPIWQALVVAAVVFDQVSGAMIGRKAYLILSGENWASDGPLLGFAGGALSGRVATLPLDWSFTNDRYVVEVEVRPDDPYSVNLLCASVGDRLYIASGSGPDATWVQALTENPALRLRVDDQIYELQATRVADSAEIDAYLDALEEKYGTRAQRSEFIPPAAEAEPTAPLFRLAR